MSFSSDKYSLIIQKYFTKEKIPRKKNLVKSETTNRKKRNNVKPGTGEQGITYPGCMQYLPLSPLFPNNLRLI